MGFSPAKRQATRPEGERRRQADLSKLDRITIWQNYHFGVLEKAGEVAGAQEIWESPKCERTKMPNEPIYLFGNVCLPPASCLLPPPLPLRVASGRFAPLRFAGELPNHLPFPRGLHTLLSRMGPFLLF